MAASAAVLFGGCSAGEEAGTVPEPTWRQVVLVDKPFVCGKYDQPVDFDLVKVTMTSSSTTRVRDAAHLSRGECTGRIGRLEIDTWRGDGLKVHQGAHDLVIESGYIRCHDREGKVHQDGVQAMGGERVTFRRLRIECRTPQGSAFFVNEGAGRRGTPTEIVCVECLLAKGGSSNRIVRINRSIRSGIRASQVVWCGRSCDGAAVVVGDEAVEPVNTGNAIVAAAGRSG